METNIFFSFVGIIVFCLNSLFYFNGTSIMRLNCHTYSLNNTEIRRKDNYKTPFEAEICKGISSRVETHINKKIKIKSRERLYLEVHTLGMKKKVSLFFPRSSLCLCLYVSLSLPFSLFLSVSLSLSFFSFFLSLSLSFQVFSIVLFIGLYSITWNINCFALFSSLTPVQKSLHIRIFSLFYKPSQIDRDEWDKRWG